MKTLICINTCKRASAIKAMIWEYIEFVKSNAEYDFVISLDGIDSETIEYCKKFNIPLIYSEENEGVGLSKNRVLELLSNYEYYFFIEDDVELLNPEVFDIHIKLSQITGIHHFSLFDASRIIDQKAITNIDEFSIVHSMYGSAQVNFFTREGLEKVGGFHDEFAIYKRFGHTEHTYRFVNAGLSTYPFNIVSNCIEDYFKWNDPISVTKIKTAFTDKRLFPREQEIIEQSLSFYPLRTLSRFHMMGSIDSSLIYIDRYNFIHKIKFDINIMVLDTLRKLKRTIRGIFPSK